MSGSKYDFGPVSGIKADAIGEPGQRHFRLLVEGPQGSATLWLEKEQLYSLALAIRHLLATIPSPNTPVSEPGPPSVDPAVHSATVELQVGNLALAHEPETDRFAVLAYERESDPEPPDEAEEADVRCWTSREELKALAEEALAVCAAGRPLCPLCQAPVGPDAHICPKHNGHVLV